MTVPGVVVKAWSNWYDCQTDAARLSCQPRGRLKRSGAVRVGDRVQVTPLSDGEGSIEAVEPRRNQLERPQVANVDHIAVVACWRTPPWNADLVDRILVHAAARGCDAMLLINKADLLGDDREEAEQAVAPYRAAGYPVLFVSAQTGLGLELLARRIDGQVVCLAGPSGAGKSRLISTLAPQHELRSGELSERLGHGRHTTRHAELLAVGSGWLVDTPGFSRLDLEDIEAAGVGACFPEIAALARACRFRRCLHRSEPDCAVRGAVDAGRYARYLRLLAECECRPQAVALRDRRPQAVLDDEEDYDALDGDGEDGNGEDGNGEEEGTWTP